MELLLPHDQKGKQRLLELGRRESCRVDLLMKAVSFNQGIQPDKAIPKGEKKKKINVR